MRPSASADKFGTIVSEIDLVLDPKTGDVVSSQANNLIVRNDRFARDPAQTQLIAVYRRERRSTRNTTTDSSSTTNPNKKEQ